MRSGCHIQHKALANSAPTGFLTTPLQTAAGVGQLFAVEQATAGTNHPVIEVAAGARNNLTVFEQLRHGCDLAIGFAVFAIAAIQRYSVFSHP